MSNDDTGVLDIDNILDGSENDVSEDSTGGSDNSGGSQGIDPKAFNDLVSAVNGMENLMGRFKNEMGDVRKLVQVPVQNADNTDTSSESTDVWSKLMDNPESFLEEKFSQMQQKQFNQNQQQVQETQSALRNLAPDVDDYMDDMVDAVAKDTGKAKHEVLNQLTQLGAPTLFNVYGRVKAERESNELKKLVGILKNQGVDLSSAKKALMKTPSSGESFSPPSSTDQPKINPRDLNDDQLKALYEKRVGKQ